MKIEIARILAGSEIDAGDGINGAKRCILVMQDGTKRSGIVKRGPLNEMASEAFSALLLRSWSLKVPEPFLVDENPQVAFACADVGYPNLKQNLGINSLPDGPAKEAALRVALMIACSLPSATLACACDEAIDNRDRNLGNILWDGTEEAWIDHAYSLGARADLADRNLLCEMSKAIGNDKDFLRGSIAQGLLLVHEHPKKVAESMLATPLGKKQDLAIYVAQRLSALGNRLVNRFPNHSMDLLAGL